MSETRTLGLETLIERLRSILGPDSLLHRRLEIGLRREDEALLATAIESLRLYPLDIQTTVEDEVLSWLFGPHTEAAEPPRTARLS